MYLGFAQMYERDDILRLSDTHVVIIAWFLLHFYLVSHLIALILILADLIDHYGQNMASTNMFHHNVGYTI